MSADRRSVQKKDAGSERNQKKLVQDLEPSYLTKLLKTKVDTD